MVVQPFLRDYNFINDYFYTTHQYYQEVYRAYPVNYYSIDQSNTVWETTELRGGSYEKAGVGDLSGVVWKKIYTLPVFGFEQILPSTTNDDRGQTYQDSLVSTISFPASYGLKPCEWDVIDPNFGFSSDSPKIKPLLLITNVNLAQQGVYHQMYKCQVKVAPFFLTDLEKQISSWFMFVQTLRKILPIDNATLILKLEERVDVLTNRLAELFDNSSAFYLKRLLT